MNKKTFEVPQIITVNPDDFSDLNWGGEAYPHLFEENFEPNVHDWEKTITALGYIFERQGFVPENINYSFERKKQTLKVSFVGVELFETGPVASLIKTICHFADKCHVIKIRGIETLEYTIKCRHLNCVVFHPKTFIRGGNLIQDVLRSLDFLDTHYLNYNSDNAVTIHFATEGQVLKMRFKDLSGKVIKSNYGRLSEEFLILSPQDKEMAEYLLSLNSNPEEDRLMIHTRYIMMVEGLHEFGCYESDFTQEDRKRRFEGMAWVKTRNRTQKVHALLGI